MYRGANCGTFANKGDVESEESVISYSNCFYGAFNYVLMQWTW